MSSSTPLPIPTTSKPRKGTANGQLTEESQNKLQEIQLSIEGSLENLDDCFETLHIITFKRSLARKILRRGLTNEPDLKVPDTYFAKLRLLQQQLLQKTWL
jgi:hypothetical protein